MFTPSSEKSNKEARGVVTIAVIYITSLEFLVIFFVEEMPVIGVIVFCCV